ncbi:phage capsid scaffolding protein [Hylemonella gracilis str. Niagara R]|uniref:Phage capsid scaffolding protein n=1 Tax=Hylemonella gracilis str. Niagara R TaxID=1458275 RepID=A0A016XIS5_9BURK|nr:GPO family capsid scaffolding protein [Hylemonella gracilis]EYC51462.1 phage capsid scaffolding protein [Hylemonella gracilis str. Niagara R]
MAAKFFRVAVEGQTTDGRTIERAHIQQMAARYNPQTFSARVWIEHLRSLLPTSEFRAQGDVLALKAEETEIDGKKRMALFAQIEPLPSLIEMVNKAKQKVFTSIELDPNFTQSGEAYMVGLGVTDTPASLGTERLAFAAQNPQHSPYAPLKQSPANVFSAAMETAMDFSDATPATQEIGGTGALAGMQAAFKAMTEFFSATKTAATPAAPANTPAAPAAPSGDAQQFAALMGHLKTMADGVTELSRNYSTLQLQHAALEEKFKTIDATDAAHYAQRPPATGATAAQLTDC